MRGRARGTLLQVSPTRAGSRPECFNRDMLWSSRLFALASLTVMSFGAVHAFDGASEATDPWPAGALVEPSQFAEMISQDASSRPVIIYVGFPALFSGAHITNSILAGPASKPEALDQLRQVVKLVPRTKRIAIYCGCCPFGHCPNIRPAYTYLHNMGFQHITVLHLPTNLHTDWVVKGYPTTKGSGA